MKGKKITSPRSIRLDEETETMLDELDKQMNLESNVSSIIRAAIKKLYQEEKKK